MDGSGSVSGTGGGGFGGQGGVSTGGRGGYTFSRVPGSGAMGNWNTGGAPVGFGSVGAGITPLGPQRTIRPAMAPPARQPIRPIRPIRPVTAIPVPPQVYPPVSGPPTRVDLNPATLEPWSGAPGITSQYQDPRRQSSPGGGSQDIGGGVTSISQSPGPGSSRSKGSYARGGNVQRPSILQQIMARSKPKQAIDAPATATKKAGPAPAKKPLSKVTQRVTNKKPPTKTPWKRGAITPAFAKGGAVEKFMARYPNFKLA